MGMKTLIVEDETISREALADMVDNVPWLERVGVADSVSSAVQAACITNPDVLFLDVKIPGGSGFDVLQQGPFIPHVIFTTAYRDFAVDAFEINAVDYLLKPFGRIRFEAAIQKLKDRKAASEPGKFDDARTMMVRVGKQVFPMRLDEIDYFRAEGDYVTVCGPDSNRLISSNLSDLENELGEQQFVRVHRSLLVNLQQIRFLKSEGDRRLRLMMRGGDELLSSRSGTKLLTAFIKR